MKSHRFAFTLKSRIGRKTYLHKRAARTFQFGVYIGVHLAGELPKKYYAHNVRWPTSDTEHIAYYAAKSLDSLCHSTFSIGKVPFHAKRISFCCSTMSHPSAHILLAGIWFKPHEPYTKMDYLRDVCRLITINRGPNQFLWHFWSSEREKMRAGQTIVQIGFGRHSSFEICLMNRRVQGEVAFLWPFFAVYINSYLTVTSGSIPTGLNHRTRRPESFFFLYSS